MKRNVGLLVVGILMLGASATGTWVIRANVGDGVEHAVHISLR